MQLVASRKDERERIVLRDRPKLAEEFSFMGKLSLVICGGTRPIGSGHAAREFATSNNIAVELHGARDLDELRYRLASKAQSLPDILVVLNDPFMFTHRKIIVDAAAQLRLPAIYGYREYADDGGLISYGASITDTYRRAAGYIDKILRGVKPADLPIELPTRFELVINLKTAKALGLEMPPILLARADEVIE